MSARTLYAAVKSSFDNSWSLFSDRRFGFAKIEAGMSELAVHPMSTNERKS